jgi:hypothetical protein
LRNEGFTEEKNRAEQRDQATNSGHVVQKFVSAVTRALQVSKSAARQG